MSRQAIENGIAALQAGNIQQGEHLLRQGLLAREVPNSLRAVGYMWLATTSQYREFQIQCYEAAVEADPGNAEARRRLDALRPPTQQRPQVPPMPPPTPPVNPTTQTTSTQPVYTDPRETPTGAMPPVQLPGTGRLRSQPGTGPLGARPGTGPLGPLPGTGPLTAQGTTVPRMWEFGVEGGPNGIGTAFLVVRNGLLATTRYVVGDRTDVVLVSRDGRELSGQVVRSYPEHDLAFIRARLNVGALRDRTPMGKIPAHTPLTADDYTERTELAEVRMTRRKLPPGWIPTTFSNRMPRSYNGAPLLDDGGDLVGMLTRNADRNTGNLYGLHISQIFRKIELFFDEERAQPKNVYCGTCGCRSAAGAARLYYCEHCGATFPIYRGRQLTPHELASQYYPTDMQ